LRACLVGGLLAADLEVRGVVGHEGDLGVLDGIVGAAHGLLRYRHLADARLVDLLQQPRVPVGNGDGTRTMQCYVSFTREVTQKQHTIEDLGAVASRIVVVRSEHMEDVGFFFLNGVMCAMLLGALEFGVAEVGGGGALSEIELALLLLDRAEGLLHLADQVPRLEDSLLAVGVPFGGKG